MLSGYKVISRRLVKPMPLLSSGFEVETELAVHARSLRVPIAEMSTPYRDRPANSAGELRTIRDGARILRTILWLIREERPLPSFATMAAGLIAAAGATRISNHRDLARNTPRAAPSDGGARGLDYAAGAAQPLLSPEVGHKS